MKGRVYAIRSHQTKDIYIGSTIETLSRRMGGHRSDYKRQHSNLSSFNILKYDDAYIELIEEVEFESKDHLRAREGHYIRIMDCVNKKIECRTDKQYRLDNKDKIKEQASNYYINNKDTIQKYREEHKEDKKIYNKKYGEEHKEQLKEQHKKYSEEHKEQLKEKAKKIYTCECGVINQICNKSRHNKSIKHQTFLLGINKLVI